MNIRNIKKAKLPKSFSFKTDKDLIRLGRDFDGGYLVSKKDVLKTDCLISFGICDDWSFEQDFIKINKVPIFAFDGSVSKKIFLQKILLNLLRINKPFRFIKKINTFISYLHFFRKDRMHIKKYVKSEIIYNSRYNANNYISMKEIIRLVNKQKKIFFKIDIEGSEYRILNDLINIESKITGLVIEFHNCDLHLEKIKDFINEFSLDLIHIHPNNAGPIDKKTLIPHSLEMTFSKSATLSIDPKFPHPLDMPCDPNNEEIVFYE